MLYHNENDPFAAEWLGNLWPKARVDARDIREVQADDLTGFERCHFFAGIGGWEYALQLAGWPAIPVWTGSCPCQPFSAAGKQKGEADERHLWPEFRRLIAQCRPPVVFGEQVASAAGREWFGGKPGLSRVRDAQAIAGVLQRQGLLGGLPPSLQGMLSGTGGGEEGTYPEVGEIAETQGMAAGESGEGVTGTRQASSEEKGHGVHPYRSRHLRCDGCGRLRADRDSAQLRQRQDVGQPISGQDRLGFGVYPAECACGALLPECDGERVGGEQDHRDSGCDHGGEAREVSFAPDETGILATLADRHRRFAGVRADLEELGYAVGAADLCAASQGAPHIRQRLYWVAYTTPKLNHGPRNPGPQGRLESANSSDPSGLADPDQQRRTGLNALLRPEERRTRAGAIPQVAGSSATHWGNQWHQCLDGKARRVEPGIFPLAHGIPARLGRLRAYGNSIIPQVAATFVRAFLDG